MCPGLGEWWLHKNLRNLVIFNIYAQIVYTLFCVKWLGRLRIFIYADILVLVGEFVVVVSADHCQPLWAHLCLIL